MQGKTIAAISTPYGRGAISLIRLSGEDSFAIADKVFFPKCKKPLSECTFGKAYYGDIQFQNETIDDGMAICFKAPNSYTGENCVEITCHGGILVTKTVLDSLIESGAYPAQAGEFTKRAYVNGKLRLSEAEAIMDIIDAKTPSALKIAGASGRGALSNEAKKITDRLFALLSSSYAYIDYPDEDLTDVTSEQMLSELCDILSAVKELERSYKTGKAVKEGIVTVICGKPNAGKSSLLNMLTGEDTAIVTDIEGTTRDVITSQAICADVVLRLSDTAGIRKTDDAVEGIGVQRAYSEIKKAELILAVFDSSRPLSDQDTEIIKTVSECDSVKIALINKSDIRCAEFDTDTVFSSFEYTIEMCAKNGFGKEKLEELVSMLFTDGRIDYSKAYISNARQYSEIRLCAESIESAINTLKDGMTQDVAALDIEQALSAVSRLDGREMTDSIVNEIFSKFCVGK